MTCVGGERLVHSTPTVGIPTQLAQALDRTIPRWALMTLAGIAAGVLIVSRRPDALFAPQFWGEDGAVWYAQAYNHGALRALFTPSTGYLVTVARLAASIAVLFPLALAPLIFNVIGISAQLLPVVFIYSRRFDAHMPSMWTRTLLAFLYVALPNSYEIDATISNAQWHLALLGFMIVIAAPPVSRRGRVFDIAALLLAGLSGPYCILLAPVIALRWWQTRDHWTLVRLALDSGAAAIQTMTLLFSLSASRVHTPLGAGPGAFVRIVSGQIYLGATVGMSHFSPLYSSGVWQHAWVPLMVFVPGTAAVLFAAWRGPAELRLLLFFAFLVFGASLVSPQVSTTTSRWLVMSAPGTAARYEFLPIVTFLAMMVWFAAQRARTWLRFAGVAVLALTFLVGIPGDWRYPPYQDTHFSRSVARFEQARPGTSVTIPIDPHGLSMTLMKH